jgi:hypothetical protein
LPTRKVKLTGLGYWAKCFEDNRDLTGYEDALKDVGGQTTIDMDLDQDNMDKLRKSKSMKRGTASIDNDGMTRVKFTRKWEHTIQTKKGLMDLGGAPKVVKADGTDWDYDEDGPIGNGSTVEVTLSVYDTTRKAIVGTRLDKVKVIEHVPYEPADDADEAPPAPQPKPAGKTPPKTSSKTPVDMDDEIPF